MNTYAVRVNNGVAEIYDAKTGSYKRSIGSDVMQARITGEFVEITKTNGKIEIYDANTGSYQRLASGFLRMFS